MDTKGKLATPLLIFILLALIAACAGQQSRARSSVVDYLYPAKSDVSVQPSTPVLMLPLKVGIAFVPEQTTQRRGGSLWADGSGRVALTEGKKSELLNRVAEHFNKYEFVSDIEVIPSAYLTSGGSFANLDQIRTMYGVDVIALVSYDQVQFTDEGFLSLTYWTLVGAYVVSGEKNDTSTMMDIRRFMTSQAERCCFGLPERATSKGGPLLSISAKSFGKTA